MDLKVYALLNAKIKELAGGGLTQAEVEKIVTDEVAKIVAGAPEDFDTLKEMSDWISQHEESAAAMNGAIQTNTNDISALGTNKVDKIEGKGLSTNDFTTEKSNQIDANKTNISTLAKHMTGDLTDSDFQEDSTVAMTKTVPSGMGDYAAIKVIGGKTVKDEENQVLKNAVVESVVSVGKNRIESVLRDTNITAEGKIQGDNSAYDLFVARVEKGKSYAFKTPTPLVLGYYTEFPTVNSYSYDKARIVYDSSIPTHLVAPITGYIVMRTTADYDAPAICEGTSATYSPYYKTTLLLPDSDKSLPCFGYGISETLQNIRDYENGKYTQMVAEVDLGDCDYTYYSATGVFFTDSVTKKANGMSNLICGSLDTATSGDKIIYGNTSSARVHIKDTTKGTTDATAFKEAMKGVKLVYELATPVVTDCSDILHPIRCEAGGTITFTNEHNLDMPNTIVYKKEVSING